MGRAGRGGGVRIRSGGFRSGRSSGGFSGAGRSGRSSHRGSSGGFGWRPRGSTVIISNRSWGGGGYRGGCGLRLLPAIFITIFILAMIGMAWEMMVQESGSSVTASTTEREALPAGSVEETGYYTDELGWISNPSALTSGMRSFYEETGVQPYLYITDSVDGSHNITVQALSDYSARLYEELFIDEAHFLVVFCEYDDTYYVGYTVGSQAKSILDDEAISIFADYLDRYYYSDLDDEEFFSRTFADTGERIMTVTKSPWPIVLVVFGLVLLAVILFFWWKKRQEQKRLDQKHKEEMLKTPLESFGDTEAEQRAKKYEQPPASSDADQQNQ